MRLIVKGRLTQARPRKTTTARLLKAPCEVQHLGRSRSSSVCSYAHVHVFPHIENILWLLPKENKRLCAEKMCFPCSADSHSLPLFQSNNSESHWGGGSFVPLQNLVALLLVSLEKPQNRGRYQLTKRRATHGCRGPGLNKPPAFRLAQFWTSGGKGEETCLHDREENESIA